MEIQDKIKRNCDVCSAEYLARKADLKRGWGRCCSKSCAAIKRTKKQKRLTDEGYTIKNGVAYDEYDCPVYRTK